jgi:hypothetical protein
VIVVDRIEGETAVLEIEGRPVDVPSRLLPEGAKEGDPLVLALAQPGERAASAEARAARLRAKAPRGPTKVTL